MLGSSFPPRASLPGLEPSPPGHLLVGESLVRRVDLGHTCSAIVTGSADPRPQGTGLPTGPGDDQKQGTRMCE